MNDIVDPAAVELDQPNKTGRPRKIDTPGEFDALVDAHVADCAERDEPLTWTGMALALGFTSRQAIDRYANYEGFSDSVKRAKLLVENAYERRLHSRNPTGAIFALKNFDWTDRQEVTHTVGGVLRVAAELTPEQWAERAQAQQRQLGKGLARIGTGDG